MKYIWLAIFVLMGLGYSLTFCPSPATTQANISINTTVASNLPNFTTAITINTNQLIAQGVMDGSCGGVTFLNSTNANLSYEIENGTCNTANTVFYIKLPTALNKGFNNTVYFCADAYDAVNHENRTGAWDANYTIVMHFGLYQNLLDSKGINNCTMTNSSLNATGKYGNALSFNSSKYQFITCSNGSLPYADQTRSISYWAHLAYNNTWQGIYRFDNPTSIAGSWDVGITTTQAKYIHMRGGGANTLTTGGFLTNGTFLQGSETHTPSFQNNSVNGGVPSSTTISSLATKGRNLTIGVFTDGSALWYLNGTLDELRISNNLRSPDWLEAERSTNYTSIAASSSLFTANFTATESDLRYYAHNITIGYTAEIYGSIVANATVNGTLYPASKSTDSINTIVLNVSILPPTRSLTNQSYQVAWNISYIDGAAPQATNVTYNFTAYPSGGLPCNANQTFLVANFTFKDDTNQTAMNLDGAVTIYSTDAITKNYSANFSNKAFYDVCKMAADNFTVDSFETYSKGGYDTRNFYIVNSNNTAGDNYTRYLGVGGYATEFTVYTGANSPIENAYIQLYRFYPSVNQLLLVAMGKTDNNGKAVIYLYPNTVTYREIIIFNNQIAYTSNLATIPCDVGATLCTKIILTSATTPNEYTAFIGANGVGCNVDNVTRVVYCTSTNPSGTGTALDLKLYEMGSFQNILVCHNHLASGSGTVICNIPTTNHSYYYVGTATIGSDTPIGNGFIPLLGDVANYQTYGMIATAGLVIAFAGFGLAAGGASAAIILAYMGFMLAWMFNFIIMDWFVLMGIGAIAAVLMFILRN